MARLNRSDERPVRSRNPGGQLVAEVVAASSPVPGIEIPELLGLTCPRQRQELQLRGRATTVAPIDEITVLHDGTTVFRVRYAAVADRHRQGFACNLTRPISCAGERWRFQIVVRDCNGSGERAAFLVADEDTACARVIDGPCAPDIAGDDPLPPMILYVECATLDQHQQILLHGWALSLDPVKPSSRT